MYESNFVFICSRGRATKQAKKPEATNVCVVEQGSSDKTSEGASEQGDESAGQSAGGSICEEVAQKYK